MRNCQLIIRSESTCRRVSTWSVRSLPLSYVCSAQKQFRGRVGRESLQQMVADRRPVLSVVDVRLPIRVGRLPFCR